MTLSRFVFKTHKWMAVSVALFTLVWFVSGIVLALPKSMQGGGVMKADTAEMDFRGIAVSVPQAIAAAEAAAGAELAIRNVELRAVEGRLYYQISATKAGAHLIDAVSGARLEITEELARQMAARVAQGRGQIRAAEMVRKHGIEYPFGPVPAYRFAFDDAAGTLVFVGSGTGDMVMSSRASRALLAIANTHTLGFLKPVLANRGTRAVLLLSSVVGTLMTLFGGWILWIQYKNWRAKRT